MSNKKPMGHIAHLSHLGQYLKISLHICIFFSFGSIKTIPCSVQGKSLPGDLGAGISTVLEIIRHFLFKGKCPWDTPMSTYHHMFPDTSNRIYMVCELRSQQFSRYWSTSGLRGQTHSVWSLSAYHQMLLV
jgi:hypothetical protein